VSAASYIEPCAGRERRSTGAAQQAAGWLGLAAAPTFALMAGISAVHSPGMAICSAASAMVPISDMALMYLLMGFFHLSPWLKLLAARSPRRDAPSLKP
jgi:hypothetical protein